MNKEKGIKRLKSKSYNLSIHYLCFISVYLFDVIYIFLNGKRMLDSDMAGEMILAKLLNDEHSFLGLSSNWFYSTELKVLEIQWFFRLGLLLFPNNWSLARTFGMAIMLLLYTFAVIKLFELLDTDNTKWGIYSATLCLLPGGGWYFWQTIFGGFYLVYILISLYSLLLILKICNKKTNKFSKKFFVFILVLLSFASGLNGVKQLMVFYAPLLLGTVMVTAYHIYMLKSVNTDDRLKVLINLDEFRYLACSIISIFSSFIGYLLNSKILIHYYSFSTFNDILIEPNSFWGRFAEYIMSFGFNSGIKLVSFSGIASICGLMIGLLTVCSGCWLLFHFPKLNNIEKVIVSFLITSILFCLFIVSCISSPGIQYFQPIVPWGLCLIIITIKYLDINFLKLKELLSGLILFVMLIVSVGTVYNEDIHPIHDYRAEVTLQNYVEYLKIIGYEKGIATFWKSNLITELSDGKIEMWTIVDSDYPVAYPWLQKTSHCIDWPDGKYFYLLSQTEAEIDLFVAEHPELELIYEDDMYVIFGN